MAEITIRVSEMRDGDVFHRSNTNGTVVVDRVSTEPDITKIYEKYGYGADLPFLYKENGAGYWHAYKLLENSGKRWAAFAEQYKLTEVAEHHVIGSKFAK